MEEKINNNFENTLFSQLDIDYVEQLVDDYLPLLYAHNCSAYNSNQTDKIKNIVETTYNKEIRKIFHRYDDLVSESRAQQNCLAYYLGIKKGLDMKDFFN